MTHGFASGGCSTLSAPLLGRRPFLAALAGGLWTVAGGERAASMGGFGGRIVFIGTVFDEHPAILRHVGNLAAGAFRFDAPPLRQTFGWSPGPDTTRIERFLTRYAPSAIVICAFGPSPERLGSERAVRQHLRKVAEIARPYAADVLLIAPPPPMPQRSLGFAGGVRRAENMVAGVAEETGARAVPTGAFFAAIPMDERPDLYGRNGYGFSRRGARAFGLTIAVALGVELRPLVYFGSDDPPSPGWIDLAEDWANAHGL